MSSARRPRPGRRQGPPPGRRQGPSPGSRERRRPERSAGGPRRRSAAGALGGEQVEGRQAVRALLLAGRRRVKDLWLAEDVDRAAIVSDIVELATELRVPVRRVSRTELEDEARSDAPQGVLAHAAPLPEVDFDLLCAADQAAGAPPFLVMLDGITDPQNVGAILRTAECAGASGAVLPRHRAAHVTPSVAKAASGAIEHLPMAIVAGMPAALAHARELGVWSVGLDAAADTSLFDLPFAGEGVALVLGAEGRGLGRLTRARCDLTVSIPLRGSLPSLNVSAAAALACFELARRRPL